VETRGPPHRSRPGRMPWAAVGNRDKAHPRCVWHCALLAPLLAEEHVRQVARDNSGEAQQERARERQRPTRDDRPSVSALAWAQVLGKQGAEVAAVAGTDFVAALLPEWVQCFSQPELRMVLLMVLDVAPLQMVAWGQHAVLLAWLRTCLARPHVSRDWAKVPGRMDEKKVKFIV
jgi:hypothetical protein